jgi:paraquat-inducible protein B
MDAYTLYKLNRHMFDALGTLVYSLNPSQRSVMLSVIHHSVDEVLTSFTAQAQAQMQAHAQAQAQAHAHAQAQAEAMAQLQAHSQALTQLQVHAQAITQLQPVITTAGPPPPAPPPQALT